MDDRRAASAACDAPIPMLRCSTTGEVRWVNAAATRALALAAGDSLADGVDASERELLESFLASISPPGSRRVVLETTHGGAIEMLGSAGDDGELTLVAYSLTSFRADIEAERTAARTDALTGLWNRTGFFDRVRELGGEGEAVTVGIVDLDRFKAVNDERGHSTGDVALKGVAHVLRAHLDPGDVVGRLGGDEFGVCITGAGGLGRAARYSSAVAADLASGVSIPPDDSIMMTASFGFAPWREGDALSTTVAEADIAMYRAKQDGQTGPVVYEAADSGPERPDPTIEELRERADVDRRTGLARDHVFERDLPIAVGRARAESTSLSILIVDLDQFHLYNERYLYERGHLALRSVAAAIDAAIRSEDRSYRYGGEEFAVLLPDTDAETATAIGERVRQAVTELAIAHADVPSGVLTVSVGVATAPAGHTVEPHWLINGANRALLDAKASGRDATRCHEPTEVVPPVGVRN
jgi:diguanylate cyclase (GGDEF)-like protein